MNVVTLHLRNFKRFTDLKLDLASCTATPKLVLLIGANGSGKSSVFDTFEFLTGPSNVAKRTSAYSVTMRSRAISIIPITSPS